MRYFALACDFDQTLADAGVVTDTTVAALERFLASGRKLVLVTGRQLPDLQRIFPQLSLFERVVAENGAVLFRPASGETKLLAEPPPAVFTDALRREGVPFSAGLVIVDSRESEDARILALFRELGLELQIIHNKGAAMVLPSGINKGTGLLAALSEMSVSPRNAVGIGDAENDHALLAACECAVAVANSIETLRRRSDLISDAPAGRGVEEIIDRILRDDLRGVPSRSTRQPILLGTTADGVQVSIDSPDAAVTASPLSPQTIRVQPATEEVRRHRRKYAEGNLGPDRSFFFRGPAGRLNLRAGNLNMFVQIAEGLDDDTWLFHLRSGDYSRWIRESIKDEALAAEVREIEADGQESPPKTRAAVIEAINRRYTRSQ